jgi:two-component system chemotaxis family response regulator WspR
LLQRDAAYLALHESQRKLMEINIELQRLTKIDGLTGVSSRRHFDEYLQAQWKQAVREQSPLAILMIDVDNFKRYNDTYGHVAGDEVLKRVAAAIKGTFVRPTDLVARFGGEEFVALLPSTPLGPLQSLGERLRANVEGLRLPHRASTVGDCVTISVGGTAMIPQREESALRFIEVADGALYEAKGGGKNRVVTRETCVEGHMAGHQP